MQKERSLKQRIVAAIMALVMLMTSLLGTTFAWFTDSVTSSGNVIQTGKLDAQMYWSDELLDSDSDEWNNAEGATPVFNYNNWEPGYTEVRYIKVSNAGSLNFKWKLNIEANGAVTDLADVIDVYYVNPVNAELESLDGLTSAGKLSSVLANKTAASGNLTAGGNQIFAIAFHMDELAGNEYQNTALCDGGFSLKLIATQDIGESDSFGDDYDAEAQWPEGVVLGNTASAGVTADANNRLSADASMTSADGKISASVPAGALLAPGTNSLTLNVANMDKSGANITLADNEDTISIDVHILGIAEDNETVMAISVKELLPVGLNMGNYRFYHVEDGQTVEMTLLADGATPAHNNYEYDPATGDVVLYLKSFSEVALVADTEKVWKGNFDYEWYDASKTEYVIANADQLAAFGAIVGGMDGQTQDSFKGKTVKLLADINLGDKESENNPDIIFYPIGYYNSEGTYERTNTAITSGLRIFEGTFDGNGHTVENFYHNTWEMKGDHDWYSPEEQYYRDGMGLFGRVYGGTIKNLTVRNFKSDGEIATTGVIAAYADFGATFENIAIFDCNPRVYNIGNGGIVGCVGWYTKGETDKKVTFKNITVDNSNKISALWGSYDVACGGIVGQYYPTSGQSSANYPVNAGIHFDNCHISAQMDVYNDVCANYQYYAYRYAGMLIGSVRENETIDGHSYPKMDGITAKDCTVHFGTWNDYYYCEIIDNTTASYTHDYQMSRLTQVASVDVENKTVTDLKGNTTAIPTSGRVNYVVVNGEHATENATCYHFKDGKVWSHSDAGTEIVDGKEVLVEDKQHLYLEFNNLVTGYGWGVTSRGFDNLNGVTNLDIQQGNQESSVEKFEDAGYTPKDYKQGETITIGDLFKVKGNAIINGSSVYVSVSPVTDGDKVNATFVLNEEDWTKSTITFSADSTGTAKVTITDYIFCTPTTIYLNEEEAKDKFVSNNINAQNAYSQITLGSIFGATNGATIGNVTATVTDPNGNVTTVTGTSADWAKKSFAVIKEGAWTVSIVDDDKYCAATEATFTVNKVDKFTKKFDKDFLYRVGNQNTVDIGYIFGEIETAVKLSSVNVQISDVSGNAAGTYTAKTPWTSGKLQFAGTGVVKITISADGANPVELNLEVIDATNVTSAPSNTTNEYKNYVFVKDISTSSYVNHWNCTIYGNGFTYSLKGAPTAYNSKQGHGILITKNATLDNLVIVGDVYESYGAYTNQDYYNTAVDVAGDTVIQNCYISGCAAPVRVRAGDATVKNTTLYGGAVANLIIDSCTTTLENVTTVNYDDGRALVGMGIVIHSDATESAKLVLNGTLTQYNFISESKVPTDTYAKNLHNAMFNNNCSQYQFGTSPNRYVNTGIISLTSTFNGEDITDNAKTGYVGQTVSASGFNGYVYTQPNTSGPVNNNYPEYKPTTQGAVPPSYSFDYTNKNYVGKTDGSNDYCYEENGKVNISMDQGDTFNWDTSILTIGKGITNYTVSMNGTDYTGKSIAFNTAGDYKVTYTYTDENNYKLDENGNITTYSVTYTKTVNITVAVVKATTKHAEFTFGSSNTASTTVTVGNNTYVMPNVSGTSSTIGSTTVSGQTIYYPIVEIIMSDGKTSHSSGWYAYFPVFSGAVTITDYADNGTGDKMTPYNSSTTTMPSGLSVVGDPAQLFKYQSKSTAGATPVVKSNKLVYSSAKIEANRNEYSTVVQYSYTDNAGATYYYYIGYHAPAQSYSNTCVTPDTLVTLADGTQKRIDEVTYNDQLLVWNHFTGKYDVAPAAIIFNHGYNDNTIIKLSFSDGTTVKVANLHQFYDIDLNRYVSIDADSVAQYVGHSFAKQSGDGFTTITLDSYEISVEYEATYGIISAFHYNIIVEGMISTDFMLEDYDLFNYFELGERMTFDEAQMQADIEKYGLYTYEDFADYLTYEQFVGFNVQYFKIAVGKGNYTYEGILELIATYLGK